LSRVDRAVSLQVGLFSYLGRPRSQEQVANRTADINRAQKDSDLLTAEPEPEPEPEPSTSVEKVVATQAEAAIEAVQLLATEGFPWLLHMCVIFIGRQVTYWSSINLIVQ
jgi:hypothetical protein